MRLGEIDTLEYHRDRGMSVTLYFGKAKGSASTADLSLSAVRETVAQGRGDRKAYLRGSVRRAARSTDLASEIPDLDLYHPWEIEPERAVALARECEAAGLAVRMPA